MTPALLFDLDGTMVSTDHLHYEAFREMLAGYGREFSHADFAARVHGRPNTLIFAEYFPERTAAEQMALSEQKEAAVRDMIDAGGVQCGCVGPREVGAEIAQVHLPVAAAKPFDDARVIGIAAGRQPEIAGNGEDDGPLPAQASGPS